MSTRALATVAGFAMAAAAQLSGMPNAHALPELILGTRSVSSMPPATMTSQAGDDAVRGTFSVVVAEVGRTGTSPWSVTLSSSALNRAGGGTIAASNLAISSRAVGQLLGGGSATAPTGSETLDQARTLFTSTGQSASSLYTGTYTGTANLTLTVPNGSAVGAYIGTLTVTLLQ